MTDEFFYKKGFEMKPSFEFSEKHLFQTSDELRSRMAEIQQLRTAILVVEAARTRNLRDQDSSGICSA